MTKELIIKLKQKPKKDPHDAFFPRLARKTDKNSAISDINYRKSAVSILIFRKKSRFFSILIEKNSYDGHHSGQIALPGGKYEIEDKNLLFTAMRETFEEIGVKLSEKDFICELSPLKIPISKFEVQPYLFFIDEPTIKIDQKEVKECFVFPIEELMDDRIIENVSLEIDGKDCEVPSLRINNKIVWGATAMILNDLKQRIKEIDFIH